MAGRLAEERAGVAEASLKDASTQLRVMATRVTALESQLCAKEAEVDDANAATAAAREGRSATESRILQLQADLRGACADTASLTAQLGVQTATAHSREVEIEELKAALQSASVREEVAEGTLGDTVSEVRRLKAECAKHQCLIKTQVCCCCALFVLRCARRKSPHCLERNHRVVVCSVESMSLELSSHTSFSLCCS